MLSFNRVVLLGNLGHDPEIRYTANGTPVCTFSMATNDRRKEGAEVVEVTTWFRVTAWGRQAELASQHLQKGQAVFVEGRLRVDEWTDRDGKSRHTLDVQVVDLQLVGTKEGVAGNEHE